LAHLKIKKNKRILVVEKSNVVILTIFNECRRPITVQVTKIVKLCHSTSVGQEFQFCENALNYTGFESLSTMNIEHFNEAMKCVCFSLDELLFRRKR